jgi:putative spermidine/putrescine transport system ATP-binding protein
MVFQRYTLFPHLNVGENVAFPLRVRRWREKEIGVKVEQMLNLVQLSGYRTRMPAQLSGGQQQRVAIARALSYDPPLLLMDEPLSALDKKLREELQLELRRIHQETGVTIIYVTHDQEEALRLSDRVAVFNEGGIEQVGTGQDLYEQPATRFVAGFIGNANFLPIKVRAVSGSKAEVAFPNGSWLGDAHLAAPLKAGENGVLMVRSDRMRLCTEKHAVTGFRLDVTVRDITYLGDSLHCSAITPWEQKITVRAPLAGRDVHRPLIGEVACIEWDLTHGQVFAN